MYSSLYFFLVQYLNFKLSFTGIHRHFVLYGLLEFLQKRFVPFDRSLNQSTGYHKWSSVHAHFHVGFALFCCSFDRQFTSDEVLQLLDRFFNLEMLVI